MFDDIIYPTETNNGVPVLWGALYKMTRSTIIHYPYTLQNIITTKDGFTTETDNIAWDFISGQVVEKNDISAMGVRTKTVTQLAYNYTSPSVHTNPYATMGPKALDPVNNKNMLSQTAAEYVYRLDPFGTIMGLISGQAITWNNSWNNYRDFDGTSSYVQGPGTPTSNVWRKNKTFMYKGAVGDRQYDGSIKFNTTSNVFDFTSATNGGWQQSGEVTRYDHYSLPLETRDPLSGIFTSAKRDFNNNLVLASASNANYSEFAYSGAEDGDNTSAFFGGEVARGSGNVGTLAGGALCHTGNASIQLTTGHSFIYKPYSLTTGRTYRAQVWATSTNGAIYYIDNNGTEQTPNPISVSQVGVWYRIVTDIPSNAIEVGVKTTGGTVSFDDFRFQPRDGGLQANVYDASTGYLTYTLGNDNLYTRYQYDDRGILMKTFTESIKYNGERLITERKDDYKRNYTNQ